MCKKIIMEDKITIGLDIGTTKISVIIGKITKHGKIEILGIGKAPSAGVIRGIVANIEKTTQSIQQALNEASTKSGLKIKNVNVGIAGQHIKSLQHRGQIVRENLELEIGDSDIEILTNNMYKLIMVPGEEIIHVFPQEYIVDKEDGIYDPKGMVGVQLEANFHIITGQTAAIKNIKKCINKANIAMTGLTLEPIASASAVLDLEEIEAGVALVDIGGGTTDIAIFKDGIIRHTAVIPFGGNVITNDIKEGCSILEKQAEQLKIKFGSALSTQNKDNEIVSIPGLRGRDPKEISLKNLASIIQARMEEIIELVVHEIKNSGYHNKLIGGIVLTGGGSQLKHLSQLVEYHCGIQCRVGYPNEHLASTSPIDVSSPMYATGVGLVIKALEDNKLTEKSKQDSIQRKSSSGLGDFFGGLLDKIDDFLGNDIK